MYTYDVYWEESDISWASRWDAYLNMPGGRVHWFSILNSLMVVLVMSSIVAMIMMRTIRRDLQRYEGLLGDAGIPLPLSVPLLNCILVHGVVPCTLSLKSQVEMLCMSAVPSVQSHVLVIQGNYCCYRQ